MESASKDMNIDFETDDKSCFSYDKNCKGKKIKDKEDDSEDDDDFCENEGKDGKAMHEEGASEENDDSGHRIKVENEIKNMIMSQNESYYGDFEYY